MEPFRSGLSAVRTDSGRRNRSRRAGYVTLAIRMRVGEVLLERGWVDWETLAHALEAQRGAGMRLCSFLVARRVVDFDHASLALGEQLGTAAVQRRHLERRDRSLAALLPVALARRVIALPIGRQRNGTLIVCARDPSPRLHDELARAIRGPFALAVAPAAYIERLVEHVYTDVDVPIDVDADSDADALDPDMLGAAEVDEVADLRAELEEAVAEEELVPVEIDIPAPATSKNRALPVRIEKRHDTNAPRDSLDAAIASFPDIDDLEWLLDVVMGYVTNRWKAALILAIDDRRAIGVRGHGTRLEPSATRAFIVPLSEPSVVQLARDERRIIDQTPNGAAKRLAVTLDDAATPTAAPIVKHGTVAYVVVVGDPLHGDHEDTVSDLEILAEALSDAVERI